MEQSSKYILKKKFLVSSAHVDFEQKLRFSSLTDYLIQSAWEHAEYLGWGSADLIKHNLVWVLSGLKIELDKYPVWQENITIETWPKGLNRLIYLRDFKIYNSENECIGRATSNWILIDIKSRRPKLRQTDSDVFQQNLDRHAIKEMVTSVKYASETEKELKFITRFSDIDLNHHLTTTRYIDMVFDSYSLDEISASRPKSMSMNFRKEVKINQGVKMCRTTQVKGKQQFQLISEECACHFLAELHF